MKICLVSCVSEKREKAAPARDLYTSKWFLKARRLVETNNLQWFILSAKHGLLHPEKIIEPYDCTLNNFRVKERKAWAKNVEQQMEAELPDADEIIILAGEKYWKYLIFYLENRFSKITMPLKGKRIGQQNQWLKNEKTL